MFILEEATGSELCVINTVFPATSRLQPKRFKLANAFDLPGQADTLTTCSPTFLILGVAGFGPLEEDIAQGGMGRALRLPCGLRIASILGVYGSWLGKHERHVLYFGDIKLDDYI